MVCSGDGRAALCGRGISLGLCSPGFPSEGGVVRHPLSCGLVAGLQSVLGIRIRRCEGGDGFYGSFWDSASCLNLPTADNALLPLLWLRSGCFVEPRRGGWVLDVVLCELPLDHGFAASRRGLCSLSCR